MAKYVKGQKSSWWEKWKIKLQKTLKESKKAKDDINEEMKKDMAVVGIDFQMYMAKQIGINRIGKYMWMIIKSRLSYM